MKKFLIILLTILSLASFGQTPPRTDYLVQPAKWKMVKPIWLDSGAYITKIAKAAGQNRVLCYDSTYGTIRYKFITSNAGTVTSVAALTLGTTGTDLSSTVANGTTTPVITLNVPTASASNRGALSSTDWSTFNNKGSGTVTSVANGNGLVGGTITGSGTIYVDTTKIASLHGNTWANGMFTGSTNNRSIKWRTNNLQRMVLDSNGNVGIGTTTPVSKLHVGVGPTASSAYGLASFGNGAWDGFTSGFFTGAAAGTLIAGNLASGSSSELINLQKGGVVYLKQDEYGGLTNKGGITANYDAGFQLSGSAGGFNKSGSGVQIESANSYTEGVQISLTAFNNYGNGYTNTSGTVNGFQNVVNFKPTSGTAVFNSTVIKPVINQTGGANGISRGLYINPTLTSAADFRAIDVAKGVVLMATYTFATLPAGIPTGSEVNISDSNTTTWGATIAGGGANNVKARYNGTNWTVIGI